jgi:hypothetical protein
MRDIAAVMVTMDRSPGENYLGNTLANLERSDLFTSGRLCSFVTCDSLSGNWAREQIGELAHGKHYLVSLDVIDPGERIVANINVSTALEAGYRYKSKWVLFLEDDIDVCANFFDSVGLWLDQHADEKYKVYAFGAAYPDVATQYDKGLSSWEYPVRAYYGTQCFAVQGDDALSLANYISGHVYDKEPDGTAWDLLMHDWAGVDQMFLASCPSFVQHIGTSSIIRPRNNVHTFDSWPGRDWSYTQGEFQCPN